LKFFREHPLNLNFASEEEFRRLVFLNSIQIYNLMAYRESYGRFVSVYELQAIEGFDMETIQKILPYIKISKDKEKIPISFKRLVKYSGHEFLFRYQQILEEQKGYAPIDDSTLLENPNSRYLGSPQKYYFRYGYNYYNKIRWGVTLEKDAGEIFLKDQVNDSLQELLGNKLRNGFDFSSFHVSLKDLGVLKALTVGDFQLQFGQGLTMWSSLAFGKSADAVNIKRFAGGVRPYTSSDENRFFRGIATTIGAGKFDISAFYSSQKIDATIDIGDTITDDPGYAESLYENGLHRTVNELLKKDAINLMLFGGHLTYKAIHLKLGLTGYYSEFNIPLTPGTRLYERFDFYGRTNLNGGVDNVIWFIGVIFSVKIP